MGARGVPSDVGERGRGRARGEAAVEVLEEFVAGRKSGRTMVGTGIGKLSSPQVSELGSLAGLFSNIILDVPFAAR